MKSDADNFVDAFAAAQVALAARYNRGVIWSLWEIFEDKTAPGMKIVNGFFDPIVDRATEKLKNTPRDEKNAVEVGDEDTLIDSLVRYTSGEPRKFSQIVSAAK